MSGDEKPVSRGAKAVAIALALLAPARMAWIVFTYGENNLSNDYGGRVGVVIAILEGRYDFANLFTDTFIRFGHSWLAIFPIYLFDARFFAWSMDAELGIGLLLAAAKTILLWLAVAPSHSRRASWLLLPVLSTLAFSVSQVTSFTFGESTLQMQLPQVGLALGAFAIARLGRRPNARISLVAIGGLLASWSWGGGVMVWPVFFAAILVLGERNPRRWLFLVLAATLGVSQYLWFLAIHRTPSPVERPGLSRPLRYLDLIGRPFANDTGWHFFDLLPAAVVFGAAGFVLAALVLSRSRHGLRERLPALVVFFWSLFVVLEIGFLRRDAAPWYIVPMTAFWLGLAGLLVAAPRLIAIAGFVTIAAGLLYSNLTWEDKSFYLPSRSPAAAACLREWRTAPPECGTRLFQWSGGADPAGLGESLERHHLSVFGPRRTYLLQGDVAVRRVAMETSNERAFLSRNDRTPADPNDFRRLDLVLAAGGAVTWRIDLPPNLKSARFLTRVRAAPGDEMLARGARVDVVGGTAGASVFVPAKSRQTLSLDLRPYAGRSVTLRVLSEEAKSTAALLFEAPRVELEITRETARRGTS